MARFAPRTISKQVFGIFLLMLIGLTFWISLAEKPDKRRETCIKRLRELNEFLESSDSSTEQIGSILILPSSIQNRSPIEQNQFVRKALQNELSEEGIDFLAEHGQFSRLAESFPDLGKVWSKKARVKFENCFALSIDNEDMEVLAVIYFHDEDSAKLIRVNNVHHEVIQQNK